MADVPSPFSPFPLHLTLHHTTPQHTTASGATPNHTSSRHVRLHHAMTHKAHHTPHTRLYHTAPHHVAQTQCIAQHTTNHAPTTLHDFTLHHTAEGALDAHDAMCANDAWDTRDALDPLGRPVMPWGTITPWTPSDTLFAMAPSTYRKPRANSNALAASNAETSNIPLLCFGLWYYVDSCVYAIMLASLSSKGQERYGHPERAMGAEISLFGHVRGAPNKMSLNTCCF